MLENASPFLIRQMKIPSTVIIGYGNPDRQDDGVAWHILAGFSKQLGRVVPSNWEEPFETTDEYPHLLFQLQLAPEVSETLANYDHVLFVDAHTGDIPNDIQLCEVTSGMQTSPFTHHMTAEACLQLTSSLYQAKPRAYLLSVRGYSFAFTQNLSPQTAFLAAIAVNKGMDWLSNLGKAAKDE